MRASHRDSPRRAPRPTAAPRRDGFLKLHRIDETIFLASRIARRYPSLLRIALPVESHSIRDSLLGDFRTLRGLGTRSDNLTRIRSDIDDFDAFPRRRREIIVTIDAVIGRRPDLEVRYVIIGFIVVGVLDHQSILRELIGELMMSGLHDSSTYPELCCTRVLQAIT